MNKQQCPYCGNNPVPHGIWWYNETLNIIFTPLRQGLLYNPLARAIKRRGWDQALGKFFLRLGLASHLLKKQTNVSKCTVRRAQVLWEEALPRGIEMYEVLLLGKSIDTYVAEKKFPISNFQFPKKSQIQNTKYKILFSGLPRPIGYSNKWLDLMDDKWLLKKLFIENHLPVPDGGSAGNCHRAKQIFDRIGKPVIVKPRAGSRGRHSTAYIYKEEDLKQAFKVAQKLCHWVMVEEQLFGPVYRATVIDGKLAGVLRGDSPQVVGDGVKDIRQLVIEKNQQGHPRANNIELSNQSQMFLWRQGLGATSVPAKGQVVNLSEKIGVSYGGSSSEDYEICHPDNKELFIHAAQILGDPIVGFDFIINDIAKSWKEQKCGFIEVNTLPFINLHHDPLHGQPRNVAAMVWEMMGW